MILSMLLPFQSLALWVAQKNFLPPLWTRTFISLILILFWMVSPKTISFEDVFDNFLDNWVSWFISFVLKTITTFVVVSSNLTLSLIYLMAQKTNPLALRLKKRINWESTFSSYDSKNYSKIFLKNQQILHSTNVLLSTFNIFPHQTRVVQHNKYSQIFSKLLQKQYFFNRVFSNPAYSFSPNDRLNAVKKDLIQKPKFWLGTSDCSYQFSDLFLNANYTKYSNIFATPKIITRFIIKQLDKNYSLKSRAFFFGLNFGILLLLRNLARDFKNNILGIKIICSGKWKKTRSGRTQKFTKQFGKIKNSSISNILVFDSSAQKTKFGVCSVKVWILIKKYDKFHNF